MKKNTLASYAIITLGCALYAVSFDWFYEPNHLTCGGFTGIAQIVNHFFPVLPVGVLLIVMNLPLYLVGFRRFGFSFLFKSLYAMVISSAMLDALAAVHTFHPLEPMLASLYGGVMLGVGSGLMMREETTTGGTELASWLLKRRFAQLSIGNILLFLDLAVILSYAAAFGSLNNALYGGVALYVTTSVLDLIVYGGNTGKLAYIISRREEEITKALLGSDMGVTKLRAEGAYTGRKGDVLLCAVRRRELVTARRIVKELDPDAFFILCDAREVLGEGFGEYKSDGI